MSREKTHRSQIREVDRKENLQLYLMMLPVFLLILVFCYAPLFGVVIAFQDYVPGAPFFGENTKWVAFKHFTRFVSSEFFPRIMRNTLVLSGLNLLFGFGAPILFALLLDQIKNLHFKKIAQTASYMPYFISTVVVAGMVINFVDKNGLITNALVSLLDLPNKNWRDDADAFPVIYTITNIWKSFGFNSILYISTMSSIDPGLYEAARMDGANRWKQCWHVTLPGIKHIIAINLIMAVGNVLATNSDLILLLYTPATYETADVIGTYTYRAGLLGGQFSFTSAASLFMSVIGFCMTYIANKVSNKMTGFGLW